MTAEELTAELVRASSGMSDVDMGEGGQALNGNGADAGAQNDGGNAAGAQINGGNAAGA